MPSPSPSNSAPGTKVHQYHIGATMLAEQVEKNSGGK
jgi:hypothetical protein